VHQMNIFEDVESAKRACKCRFDHLEFSLQDIDAGESCPDETRHVNLVPVNRDGRGRLASSCLGPEKIGKLRPLLESPMLMSTSVMYFTRLSSKSCVLFGVGACAA
jgi:hypothetical protein